MIRRRLQEWGMSRRSGWLLLWGIGWVAYGLALHDAPQDGSLPLYSTVPMAWQGWAWVAVGVVSILSGIVPRLPRTVGFTVAVVPPLLWSLGFVVLWFTSWREVGWQGMLIWGVLTTAVVMSGRDAEVRSRS